MFIAVINENFNVAEESKKGQQATDYWATTHEPHKGHVSWVRRLNPYRWVKAAPVSVRVENLPSNLVLPMQKALVQDYNMTGQDGRPAAVRPFQERSVLFGTYPILQPSIGVRRGPRHYPSRSLTILQQLFAGDVRTNDVPLTTIRQARRDSAAPQDPTDDETERHL
jgi:voltage-dependent calcium channel